MMINKTRILNEFIELVSVPCPSKDEKAEADLLVQKLQAMGLEVKVDDAGRKIGGTTGNVWAFLPGNVEGAAGLFFEAHMDSVPPTTGTKVVRRDGVLYSDGTTTLGGDDKVGIAAVLEAVRAVQEQAARYMHVMVYGELIETPQVEYAAKIASLLPAPLESVYFVNSGAEAVEGALKLAKRFTRRTEIVSMRRAYHGSTHGAMSMMGAPEGEEWKGAFRPLLPDVQAVEFNGSSEDLKLNVVYGAAHGTKCFTEAVAVVKDDVILAAYLDDFQFTSADAGVTAVPNSDSDFAAGYAEGKVLMSKRANADYYSKMMAEKGGSTVALDANFDAIQNFAVGKTISELEDVAAKGAEAVDAVSGATLVLSLIHI